MQTSLSYRTNRDLFSNHYLDEHLPETAAWDEVGEAELREAREAIIELWEREQDTAPQRNESQLEEKFIRPMFRKLGIPFEVEEKTSRTQRVPDYGFFESEEAARNAFERREKGGDFYKDAVAVADAKRWDRPLDTRGSGEHERDFENPSYQIHVYLQETPSVRWGVLTDGQKWRLYYGPTSHRLDSYYEVDLPTVLETGDLEAFKYFYLFFRHEAFLEDASGDSFLDDVYEESNVFARELGEDLQDNIYNAIEVLADGFLAYPENDLSASDLNLIHDSALIYLYRVIFVLYAEAEGRELLDTDNEIYETSFSLIALKQDVAEELDSADPRYRDWQDDLWSQLDKLFKLIDQGSESRGIPEDDLYIPAYNGGLFRTAPDADDSPEARFLAEHAVGDAHLAEVIDLLTRSRNGGGRTFVDYSSLDVRHLGSIYEGLLEYQLNVADGPLALEDGEYVPADGDDAVEVEAGEVYLTTDSGERKATGSYYTPEYVVEYIVENTLGPLVTEIREDLAGRSARDEGGFAAEFAERVFELMVLDPAMGSGHFLTNAVDYLAREIIDAQERQAAQEGLETVDEGRDINWARRQVAQRCIYGVDLNPLATELAKVSLWLRTLASEQPLAFLDHHLKTGNSLVGSDIEDVLENGSVDVETEAGQLTLVESFDRTRRRALDHVTDRFQALLAIDNETLEDVKEMEAVFDEVRDDSLYRHLLAMANVHTADAFGLDVPSDAYERMAAALRDDSWDEVEAQDWFRSAQAMAADERFFHWELEFPVAFYGEDGERDEDAGFDAVIGNPPYVRIQRINDTVADYLFERYQTCAMKTDLSIPFLEKAIQLISDHGSAGYISTSQWISTDYGRAARNFLGQGYIRRIIDFGSLPVFEGISTYPAVFILDKSEHDTLEYAKIDSIDNLNSRSLDALDIGEYGYDRFDEESWIFKGLDLRQALAKAKETEPLSEWGQFNIGAITGMDEVFVVTDEEIEELGLERELIYPHAHRGEEISRYSVVDPEESVIYPYEPGDEGNSVLIPEKRLEDEFPNIHTYLKSNQSDLRERRDSRRYYADGPDWYRFLRQGRYDYIGVPKLLARGVAKEACVGLLEAGSIFSGNNCPGFVPADDISGDVTYLLALLNSSLISEYLQQVCPAKMQGYIRLNAGDLNSIPVRSITFDTPEEELKELRDEGGALCSTYVEGEVDDSSRIKKFIADRLEQGGDDVIHDLLSSIAKDMTNFVEQREDFNLKLLDYLGNYTEGSNLPDVGRFQPTSTNHLDSTTEDLEKLRVGDVRTERDGSSVTINATVRYKPEDEDEHETDRWGYTETGYIEAFTLSELSENEVTLVEAFVPVAVEESDGFAGFRDNATKTTSLVDRLKAITLPDPDDVEDDLRRYVETKERADELDEKIEKTDQLIDEIVYELYGLTDEEIEIVEPTSKEPDF